MKKKMKKIDHSYKHQDKLFNKRNQIKTS